MFMFFSPFCFFVSIFSLTCSAAQPACPTLTIRIKATIHLNLLFMLALLFLMKKFCALRFLAIPDRIFLFRLSFNVGAKIGNPARVI